MGLEPATKVYWLFRRFVFEEGAKILDDYIRVIISLKKPVSLIPVMLVDVEEGLLGLPP
jgi:hypothetical protein